MLSLMWYLSVDLPEIVTQSLIYSSAGERNMLFVTPIPFVKDSFVFLRRGISTDLFFLCRILIVPPLLFFCCPGA